VVTVPATWIARQVGYARSAHALDIPWLVEMSAAELEAAASGPGDWRDRARAAARRVAKIAGPAADALAQVERLAVGVVRWTSERQPGAAGEARRQLAASAARLVAADPVVDLARPRYRWRLPWTGDGLAAFADLLAPVLAGAGPHDAPAILDADAALARCEAIAADVRGADAPDDPTAPRAAVTAACDAMLARDALRPEPGRGFHARALRAAVAVASTGTAIDVMAGHADACFAVEHAWWRALVTTLIWPLRAALLAGDDPAAAASIEPSRAIAEALAGVRDPLRVPWLARRLATQLPVDIPGVELGEAGFELTGPYRTLLAAHPGTDLAALTATTAASATRTIRLWDREAAIAEAEALAAAPTRPDLAGSSATAAP
jgi:hypothetical protein